MTKISKICAAVKSYAYHNAIAFDQLCNALANGAADETFSSRVYRGAVLAENPKKRWRVWHKIVETLFFWQGGNHCKTAYESELHRRQYPAEFQQLE